ncbi:MAG: hypothetical protein AADX96_21765 [Thiocapsa sp. C3-sup]
MPYGIYLKGIGIFRGDGAGSSGILVSAVLGQPLNNRIQDDKNGSGWFGSDDFGNIPLEIISYGNNDDT